MACRLLGAKPLPEPMLIYCQFYPKEQTSVKFESKFKTFHSWQCVSKYRLRNGGHFVQKEMGFWRCHRPFWMTSFGEWKVITDYHSWRNCKETLNLLSACWWLDTARPRQMLVILTTNFRLYLSKVFHTWSVLLWICPWLHCWWYINIGLIMAWSISKSLEPQIVKFYDTWIALS